MANYRAIASGLWSAGATWAGGAVPPNGAGHSIYSNTFTVTVDINADVALVTNAANAGTFVGGGTAAANGSFTMSNGVTLTAAVSASLANCVNYAGASPNSATIVGTVTGAGSAAIGVSNNNTGTLIVTSAGTHTGRAFSNGWTGTLTITGNCTATGAGGSTPLLTNSAGGVVNLTGNLVGGTGGASVGINNSSIGAINIIGNVTGGTAAQGVSNSSTGLVTIIGNVTATNMNAVSSTSATVRVSGSFIHAIDGLIPVSAPRIILNTTPALAKVRFALNGSGGYVDMFTADNSLGQAVPSDVRSGTVYASGNLTGTCAVPAAGSVSLGVPVGSGFGTAVLTPEAVWGHATRTLTAGAGISASDVWSHASRTITGGLVDTATTLTNAPTVPSVVQIRQEMDANSTKLANLDTTVSSRLASSVSTNITAIKAKTDLLNTDRLAQCATTSIVGSLIAQSNS